MEYGFNNSLVVDVFGTGRLIERIIEGQRASDEVQSKSNVRLGYMGHLTLISAEVIKFSETYNPHSLPPPVADKVLSEEWLHYTETSFVETRERDNAILGGIRPDAASYQTLGHHSGADNLDDVPSDQGFPPLLGLGGLSFSISDGFSTSDHNIGQPIYLNNVGGQEGGEDRTAAGGDTEGQDVNQSTDSSIHSWTSRRPLDLTECDQVGELSFEMD